MEAFAVIGAGVGDEEKGRWTDQLAHRGQRAGARSLVVRYNSGAQAGHTVQLPDGRRHVFHHLGSGTFAGAATYLGPGFAVHPMLFLPEWDDLRSLGVTPRVMVAPEAPVTTPYDVLINQALEGARGDARHGSCGVGFGETIERHEQPGWSLTMQDLTDHTVLRHRMDAMRREYVPPASCCVGVALGSLGACMRVYWTGF